MKTLMNLSLACAVLLAFTAVSAKAQEALFRSTIIGSNPNEIMAGVKSGGAAWQVTRARVLLNKAGNLRVALKGLVLVSTGTSPVAQIAASLVCGGSGGAVAATTDAFGLTSDGNSDFEEQITLPSACLAPVVIVRAVGANGPGAFIAASGFDASNDGDDSSN